MSFQLYNSLNSTAPPSTKTLTDFHAHSPTASHTLKVVLPGMFDDDRTSSEGAPPPRRRKLRSKRPARRDKLQMKGRPHSTSPPTLPKVERDESELKHNVHVSIALAQKFGPGKARGTVTENWLDEIEATGSVDIDGLNLTFGLLTDTNAVSPTSGITDAKADTRVRRRVEPDVTSGRRRPRAHPTRPVKNVPRRGFNWRSAEEEIETALKPSPPPQPARTRGGVSKTITRADVVRREAVMRQMSKNA